MGAERLHPASSATRPTVLYVDDDAPNRQAFQAAFRRDMDILLAGTSLEALDLLSKHQVHVIITDQRMPLTQGHELLRLVRERHPRVRRMLVTGYADLQAVIDAVNQGGVMHYIPKPWNTGDVLNAVRDAFAGYLEEAERTAYTERLVQANQQLEFALRQHLLS